MITVLPIPWRCTAGHNCSLRRRKAELDTVRWFHKDFGICELPFDDMGPSASSLVLRLVARNSGP